MIYDTFCFFNELDLLEIRLNILDKDVDYFVICESKQTFSGQEKPLYYLENKERFAKWSHKIIHLEAPAGDYADAFQRAGFQKDYIRTALTHLSDEDIVYFGDLDEIWKPQEVGDEVYNLEQLNYCYFLNNRSSEEWVGTIVSKYKNIKNDSLNRLRATHTNQLFDGGWHFTNMGGADQIRKKLEAYDHQEFNLPGVKGDIENRIAEGRDYVGRTFDWQGKTFDFFIDESELPQYIISNKEKYVAYFR